MHEQSESCDKIQPNLRYKSKYNNVDNVSSQELKLHLILGNAHVSSKN